MIDIVSTGLAGATGRPADYPSNCDMDCRCWRCDSGDNSLEADLMLMAGLGVMLWWSVTAIPSVKEPFHSGMFGMLR